MNIKLVPVKDIIVKKDRARKDFGEVASLAESIKRHGLINPITVHHNNVLVAGERRLRAYELLKVDLIPCHIFEELSPIQQKEIELEENLKRKDMTWQEEVSLVEEIYELKKSLDRTWTIDKLADYLGLNPRTIKDYLAASRTMKSNPELASEKNKVSAISKTRRIQNAQLRKLLLSVEEPNIIDENGWDILSPSVKLWKGSCLDALKTITDNSIDLVITDPPFGVNLGENDCISASWHETYNDTASSILSFFPTLCEELFRVAKPGSHIYVFSPSIYVDIFMLNLKEKGFNISRIPLIWVKGGNSGNLSPLTYYGANYECIIYGFKGTPNKLNSASGSVLDYPGVPGHAKIHPAEKPVDLLRFLINQSSIPGETILDCFGGSGALGEAAGLEGRKALLCELSENWQGAIEDRLGN